MAVEATALALSYGETPILKGIDFSLSKGETLALLGPSGCGKTTLLRIVAGLLAPTKGSLEINGIRVADATAGTFVPPEKRNLGMVFQDYALWPHMTVAGNVSFPLEMRRIPRADRERRVLDALKRVGLLEMGARRTSDLSGGQQQRVAIARAIVAEPGLVLFDEPLSNLDRELRETMVAEIGELVSSLGLTAIYVTHDHSEAFSLADRVAVMQSGLIEQLAPPEQLVNKPASPFVAEFLRLGCVAPVERIDGIYRLAGTSHEIAESGAAGERQATHVLLPSRAARVGGVEGRGIPARVIRTSFRGDGHQITAAIDLPSASMELQFQSGLRMSPGERVHLSFDTADLRWFSTRPSERKSP